MKLLRIVACLAIAASASFNASAAGKGEKIYDKIFVVVKSDDVILVPQSLTKELAQSTSRRLIEFAMDRAEEEGAFAIAKECGPRTLMLTLDIVSITSNSEATASRAFFSGNINSSEKKNFIVGITSAIRDCVTERLLIKSSNSEDGKEPLEIISRLADNAVQDAIKRQYSAAPNSK